MVGVGGKGTFNFRMSSKKKVKIGRKRVSKYGKRLPSTSRLVRIINDVSLRKAETKESHNINEDIQLYHNVENIKYSLLYTQQSIGDSDTGLSNYSCRVGNEVVARGLSIKLWIATKKDRPNVMFRIIVFRYRADTTVGSVYKTQGSTNCMIKDVDTQKITVLKAKRININMATTQFVHADQSSWAGKEAHRLVKFWIPMKNKKLRYKEDNSGSPKYTDIGVSIVPYDSFGTLQTDNLASYAIIHKFYFKDP